MGNATSESLLSQKSDRTRKRQDAAEVIDMSEADVFFLFKIYDHIDGVLFK